jgi:hypothetical protein
MWGSGQGERDAATAGLLGDWRYSRRSHQPERSWQIAGSPGRSGRTSGLEGLKREAQQSRRRWSLLKLGLASLDIQSSGSCKTTPAPRTRLELTNKDQQGVMADKPPFAVTPLIRQGASRFLCPYSAPNYRHRSSIWPSTRSGAGRRTLSTPHAGSILSQSEE